MGTKCKHKSNQNKAIECTEHPCGGRTFILERDMFLGSSLGPKNIKLIVIDSFHLTVVSDYYYNSGLDYWGNVATLKQILK